MIVAVLILSCILLPIKKPEYLVRNTKSITTDEYDKK